MKRKLRTIFILFFLCQAGFSQNIEHDVVVSPEQQIQQIEKIKTQILNARDQNDIESEKLCYGKKLRTIDLTIPKYNTYSQQEICSDIPTFYLCREYINFDIDSEKFIDNVENYKKRIEKKEVTNPDSTNNNVINTTVDSTFSTISEYKYIIVGVIIFIGIIVTILIIRKHRKRVI